MAACAFIRVELSMVTSTRSLTSESRSFASVFIFMYSQAASEETGWKVLPGIALRSLYSIPTSVATINSLEEELNLIKEEK